MPVVLFAWEYGRHLGHISRMRALAEDLCPMHVQTRWCVPPGMERHFQDLATQGPVLPSPPANAGQVSSPGPIYSFADILLALGLGDTRAMRMAVANWHRIFDRVQPDGVVLDYAPVAQVAAQLAGLKALRISNGFDAPPPSCPPFDLGIRGPFVDDHHRASTSLLSTSMTQAGTWGGRTISLAASLAYPTLLLDTIAELDPYGARTEGAGSHYVGPVFERGNVAMRHSWPAGGEGPRVFAYLRACHGAMEILTALSHAPLQVLCVCPDASSQMLQKFNSPAMTVVRETVDLECVLGECAAVVNYGSGGMVCASMLHGKPQLIFPADIEKKLMAMAVHRCGAGRIASRDSNAGDAILNLLDEACHSAHAHRIRDRYSTTDFTSVRRQKISEWLSPARSGLGD